MFCYPNTRVVCAAALCCVRRFSGLALLCLTLSTSAQALAETTPLTLSTAITQTLNENPALQVFSFRREALDGNRATAQLRPGYELGVEAENFAGSGDTEGFSSAEFTLSLSSVVELGDKRNARISAVGSRYHHLTAQQEIAALELMGEVTRRFVAVLAAQHRLALARESAQLAQQTYSEVNTQSNAGVAPLADVKRAAAAAAQARLTVTHKEQELAYLKVALAAMWGEHTPAFTSVAGDLYQFGDTVAFDTLINSVEQNPAIQIFAAEEGLRSAELRLARTQSRTDISWSVGVKRLEDGNDTALVAGVSIPLFSGQRNRSATQTATAARNEVFVRRDVALTNIRTQLFHAYTSRAQAILTVEQLRSTIIPALADALQETKRAYDRGRYRYLDYLSARQEWIAARRALIDAASNTLIYGAEIEQLTAEPLAASSHDADATGMPQ